MNSDNSHRHKKDEHYKKAKRQGYRARSAYKLLEIQKKFNIFKRAFYILDIGSNPGSWLQVSIEIAEENLEKYNDNHYHRNEYKIMGVDLNHVSPIEGIKILKMDATSTEFKQEISSHFNDKLDLIISDASIKKSGNKFSDHVKQIQLCYKILDLALEFLKLNGNLVLKSFQGPDFQKLYKDFKKAFNYAKSFKPKASKKKSNELFLVGMKKK
ncbi:MAG: hypothetical protein GF317_15525 [Candidatus Lokiarchaeota archaeon]|nr:hypothetical protein [Candidatus Lokiarchaeota archaeon]MBD3200973.1 hypothetical protein [Candidatus Lokiarchaeota archaeon]